MHHGASTSAGQMTPQVECVLLVITRHAWPDNESNQCLIEAAAAHKQASLQQPV